MKKVMLLAHRGFSGKYPENSPLAFHKAVEETSADGFESDVHITKDGKLIIFHDATVERTSNGIGFSWTSAPGSPPNSQDSTSGRLISCSISATRPICCSIWS